MSPSPDIFADQLGRTESLNINMLLGHSYTGDDRRNEGLERIGDEVDWERFAALVDGVYSEGEGRPSYPPLMMVKVLLLEQWYNLSDPQMEEPLGDRMSFRRFVGLGLQDDTPDYSTISRFRTELSKRGLSEELFKELEAQLDKRGLILKEGTLMARHSW